MGLRELMDPGTVIAVSGGMTPDELELMADVQSWFAQQKDQDGNGRNSQ